MVGRPLQSKLNLSAIKEAPSLAIVIPVYNEAKILAKTLKMLDKLTVEEIIFVDGGSTDSSKTLISKAGHTCLQSGLGRGQQMNFGTKSSQSDIILYLHVDTSISSSNISNIKKSYNHGFISGRFDVTFTNKSLSYSIISFFINLRSRVSNISTGDQAIFVRRDVMEQLGGYPEIALMEDVALSKRLKRLGRMISLRDKIITSSRRWEENGPVKTVLLMWKIRFLYWAGVSPDKLAKLYRKPQ